MTENTTKKTAQKAVSKQKETAFIYCGPANKFVPRYTTYKNGLPIHVSEQLKECPIIKQLFVPLEQFCEFEVQVKTNGTVENIWFKEAEKYFKEGVTN